MTYLDDWETLFSGHDPSYVGVLASMLSEAGFQVSCVAVHRPKADRRTGMLQHLRVRAGERAKAQVVLDSFLREAKVLDDELGDSCPPTRLTPPPHLANAPERPTTRQERPRGKKVINPDLLQSGVYVSARGAKEPCAPAGTTDGTQAVPTGAADTAYTSQNATKPQQARPDSDPVPPSSPVPKTRNTAPHTDTPRPPKTRPPNP